MKQSIRHPWFLLTTALCALGLFMPGSISAQCVLDSSGYLYAHPYFAAKSWRVSLSEVDIALPDTICALKPQTISYTNNSTANVCAFRAQSGSLYAANVVTAPASCFCCNPELQFGTPVRLILTGGIPLASGTPCYVVKEDDFPGNNFVIAAASASGRAVVLATVAKSGFGVTGIDSLQLSNTAGGRHIYFIGGDQDSATGSDKGIWIAGSDRLLRYFPYANGTWGAEQSFTIGAADTITCVGGGYAGTWSGTIYRRTGANFVQDAAIASKPLRMISTSIAAGDNGTALWRNANGWHPVPAGTKNYRAVASLKQADGSSLQLLSDRWNDTIVTYADSPTVITRTVPDTVKKYLNAGLMHYMQLGPPLTLSLIFHDQDSNESAPRATVFSSTNTNLNDNGTYFLDKREPNRDCSSGKLVLADTVVTIKLWRDSVVYEASCQLGKVDLACNKCYWAPYTFHRVGQWRQGDRIVIKCGKDSLKISYPSTAVDILYSAPDHLHRVTMVRLGNGAVRIPLVHQSGAPLASVSFYGPSGKLLKTIPSRDLIAGNANFSASGPTLTIVRCTYADGRVYQIAVPVVH
jgi:hypothetical protein